MKICQLIQEAVEKQNLQNLPENQEIQVLVLDKSLTEAFTLKET